MSLDRERLTTTCDDGGNECQISFKPKDDMPVYCKECFQNHTDKISKLF